MFNRTCQHL